jgi:hypothetical protein
LDGFFKRRSETPAAVPAPASPDIVATSKVFPRFLAALSQQPAPVLLDLGPVVGPNIGFFGDRLSCKIYVEDLVSDIEAHARRGERDRLAQFFGGRLTQGDESVDGVLCWDVFDFLDKAAGLVLARKLAKLVRKGGALYGSFGTTAVDLTNYSRVTVESEDKLRARPFPASPVRRHVLLTRDIIKMFDGLTVAESVLLKTSTRETLFRKT